VVLDGLYSYDRSRDSRIEKKEEATKKKNEQ
jgi:hypothetical protein